MVRSDEPRLRVVFYRTTTGREPVREWLRGLWEVRSRLRDGVARVLFFAERDVMALVHGFIK